MYSLITNNIDYHNKMVLDFGCGIGSICSLFQPSNYLGLDCDSSRISYAQYSYPDYRFDVLRESCLPISENLVDYILIISVLHHIPSKELYGYIEEFRRVLKPNGKIFIIEPCFFENTHFSNKCMNFFDKGKYIRNEDGYLELFNKHYYKIEVLKKFKQLFFYNKLFFTAVPY
jgi:ubiquinone/menaquinone biosynthesis C-methylase UbiE